MSTSTPTFEEYLNSAQLNYPDVVEALKLLADAHPIFKSSAVLQDIINGKTKEITVSLLSNITKTALHHSMSISRKSLSLQPNQQLKIAAEINVINAAISLINCVRQKIWEDTLTTLSEIEALRRFHKGEI